MELAEKVTHLRHAGFDVHDVDRTHAADFGYLRPYDTESLNNTEDAEPWADLGRVARGEDTFNQTSTLDRSNYRTLREEYPDAFTDMCYANQDSLGAFVSDLSDDLVGILCNLSTDYPVYDEEDLSSLEDEEISASWDEYLYLDVRRSLTEDECDALDSLDPDTARDAFYSALSDMDYYPEHNGYEVLWKDSAVTEAVRAVLKQHAA